MEAHIIIRETSSKKRQHEESQKDRGRVSDEPDNKIQRSETDGNKPCSSNKALEENLLCPICQDIFHDCVSCQPCMHSFCAGCLSVWKEKSSKCPTCRRDVKTIGKNHSLNNLSVAYLNMFPGRKRSANELAELDKKNTIQTETVKVDTQSYDDSYGSSEENSLALSDSTESGLEDGPFSFVISGRQLLRFDCPNCPGNRDQGLTGNACAPDAVHLVCSCCSTNMPQSGDNGDRKCSRCSLFFCHLVWPCRKAGCRGCLARFKDLNFSESAFDNLLLNNSYESQIFKDHCYSQERTIKDVFSTCVEKLQNGTYSCTSNPNLSADDIICYRCGLLYFKELAYLYRKDVRSQLPPEVTIREDCHWGKNCRTQTHSMHHASKFNHICEQTRFVDSGTHLRQQNSRMRTTIPR